MSRNIKEIGKELLGKSLNSYHRRTGLTQLEKNNEMQDGILNGILSQVDDAYIEKTEQSNVIHLEGSGDGVVVLDSIEGNTLTDAISSTTSYSLKNTTKSINSRWSTIGISCRQGKLNDKIYYRIKLKINNLTTDSSQLSIMSMRDSGGYNHNVALFKDLEIGNINEISTIRAIDSNCNNLYNSVTIGNHGEVPSDCTDGVEFANFTLIDFIVVNLTELFGSGNEPTKEWCDSNIPYFEGLQSSFEEKVNDDGKYEIEILSKNKSLINWNIENLENYHDDSFNFSIEDNAIKVRSNYQKAYGFKKGFYVQEGETYTISVEGKKTGVEYSAMYLGDETLDYFKKDTFILVPAITSSNIIDGSNYGTKVVTMVARKSGFVNRWIIHSSGLGNYYWIRNVFLEKGETVSCIPQKQNKIKLLLDEPLRSISTMKDKLCIKDGKLKVERNLGQVTFSGNEDWQDDWQYSNEIDFLTRYYTLSYNEFGKYAKHPRRNVVTKCLSDSFSEVNCFSSVWGKQYNYIAIHGDSNPYYFQVSILKSMVGNDLTKQGFKNWIKNNGLSVVYPLAEPYYEEVLNEYGEPILLEEYENGTIYIDSTIVPTTTVRYTPKMESFKTLKEVENNNIMLTNDVNDNIIPYMMDVDLMIMEKEMALMSHKNIRKMEVLDMTSMQKRTQDMLERLIKGKTLTEQECKTRVTTYLHAGKITDEQAEELMLLIDEVYA